MSPKIAKLPIANDVMPLGNYDENFKKIIPKLQRRFDKSAVNIHITIQNFNY